MRNRQVEELAVFVHGVLAGLHALGVLYNLRRGKKVDALCHTFAMFYDVQATIKHIDSVRELQ